MSKGTGTSNPAKYGRGPNRSQINKPAAIATAADETEAYKALQWVKRRARWERERIRDKERAAEAKAKVTLPRLKFMEQPE